MNEFGYSFKRGSVQKIHFWLFVIFFLGLGLRLYRLGAEPFWFDEGLDLLNADIKIFSFNHFLQAPYLHSFFLSILRNIAGSEFFLRLPSALASSMTIIVMYWLGKLLFGEKEGLVAAIIFAVSPFHIYYAQHIRPYAISCFFVSIAFFCFIKALREGKIRHWVFFEIFSLAAIYMHYSSILVFLTENVFFLIRINRYKALRIKWYVGSLIAFVFLFAALNVFFATPCVFGKTWCIPPVSGKAIVITLKNFLSGYHAGEGIYRILFTVGIFLAGLGAISLWGNDYLLLLGMVLFLPLGILYGATYMNVSIPYIYKYVMYSSLFLYLFVSKGIGTLLYHGIQLATIVLIVGLSLFSLHNCYLNRVPNTWEQNKEIQQVMDTRAVAAHLVMAFKANDKVCFADENTIPQIRYYVSEDYLDERYRPELFSQFTDQAHFTDFNEPEKQTILRFLDKDKTTVITYFDMGAYLTLARKVDLDLKQFDRLWLVAPKNINGRKVIAGLKNNLFVFSKIYQFEGVNLFLFNNGKK